MLGRARSKFLFFLCRSTGMPLLRDFFGNIVNRRYWHIQASAVCLTSCLRMIGSPSDTLTLYQTLDSVYVNWLNCKLLPLTQACCQVTDRSFHVFSYIWTVWYTQTSCFHVTWKPPQEVGMPSVSLEVFPFIRFFPGRNYVLFLLDIPPCTPRNIVVIRLWPVSSYFNGDEGLTSVLLSICPYCRWSLSDWVTIFFRTSEYAVEYTSLLISEQTGCSPTHHRWTLLVRNKHNRW